MPLPVMRPSPATDAEFVPLECALKKVIVGDNAGPFVSTDNPGVALRSAPTARAAGSALMTSLFMTIWRFALCTSTTGDAPVTVTVSSSAPTFSSAGIVPHLLPRRPTFSRLALFQPAQPD